VNEQLGLISMHTLFVREHNRVAEQIAQRNPTWSDERIFQKARSFVIAEVQAITYHEFLPALLGVKGLKPYTGYRPQVNPGVSNEFATAAFRVGHTMLSSELLRLNNDGTVIEAGNIPLRDSFFNPAEIRETDIDPLLKGLASQAAQEIDNEVVDEVRNFLFGPPGAGGFDLASLNIQRGRDHGLADYNQTRVAFGLPKVTSFAQITRDPATQARLAAAYDSVDEIDLWVGALSEDHARGASVGPLIQRIVADQFVRVRDADRYWYQRTFAGAERRQLENTRLADIIRRNSEVSNLQRNVFFMPDASQNRLNPPAQPHPGASFDGNTGGKSGTKTPPHQPLVAPPPAPHASHNSGSKSGDANREHESHTQRDRLFATDVTALLSVRVDTFDFMN
jgi:hypothetical protein